MAILKVKKIKHISRKVNLKEEVYNDLKLYKDFLGFSDEKEDKGEEIESEIINQALEHVFEKDKDFKKYKERIKDKKVENTPSDNDNSVI